LIAAALGLAFLAVKGVEYRKEYVEGLMPFAGPPSPLAGRPAELFMGLYFIATGLHALHLTIGVVLVGGAAIGMALKRLDAPQRTNTIDLIGLYWHLVDIVWVFLFPMLYLARP
jgi:cytochrome c oxidase subunit 3